MSKSVRRYRVEENCTETAKSRRSTGTAKKSRTRRESKPYSDPPIQTDALMSAVAAHASQHTGDTNVYTAADAERWISVIPMPGLALEYLFAQNGLPLSRAMHLFGVQHSGKSALACEILRWHLVQQGYGAVIETEGKDIPDLRNSILNNADFARRVWFTQDPGTDLWQKRLTGWLQGIKATSEKAERGQEPLGLCYPFNALVDSIGAAATSEERDKIVKAGYASRSHPATALSLAQYFRTLPDQLISYPVTLTFVNHQKPTQNAQGLPDYNTYGGRSVRFHVTYELELLRTKFIKLARSGGIDIQFRLRKNGLGECDRRINAQLIWLTRRDSNGDLRQYSYWDWHGSAIDLLLKLREKSATIKSELEEVLDLRTATGRRVYSKALGISKTSPIRYDEAGALLHANRELVTEVRKVLGIQIRPTFEPGVNMLKQRDKFEQYKLNWRECPAVTLSEEAAQMSNELAGIKQGHGRTDSGEQAIEDEDSDD